MTKRNIKKTIKKNNGGSSSRSRSHNSSSRSRSHNSSSRSRSHNSSSRSNFNKINKLFLKEISINKNNLPGSQLKNIKNIFDESYKCYSINNSLEGRVVEKWLNWILPLKPDINQQYKTIDCPYGEFLIWTTYKLLDNTLVKSYKNGYFFLREMFTRLEENGYTGIFKLTKKYEKLYNKLKQSDDLKKIFYNNYPEKEKQFGKNHITLSNTTIIALLDLFNDKKN